MSRVTTVLMLVAILFLVPVAAQATFIENVTTSTTMFYDNFEGGTVGNFPVASVGTWSSASTTPNVITVEDFSTTGITAYEGDQFAKVYSSGSKFKWLVGALSGSSSSTGDTCELSLAFMANAGGGSGFYLYDDTGVLDFIMSVTGPSPIAPFSTANTVYFYDTATPEWYDAGITIDPDNWNTLSISHVHGAGTYDVSLNGATAVTVGSFGGSTSGWGEVYIGPNTGTATTLYLDAIPVPEPSTLALLATGLIGLLAYAWRKRK